jgi:hypothetical protein
VQHDTTAKAARKLLLLLSRRAQKAMITQLQPPSRLFQLQTDTSNSDTHARTAADMHAATITVHMLIPAAMQCTQQIAYVSTPVPAVLSM